MEHGEGYHSATRSSMTLERNCVYLQVPVARRRDGGPHYANRVMLAHGSLRAPQGVRDQRVARRRLHEVMAAGHNNQLFLTTLLIDDRRGLTAGREHVTPQDLAGLDVDRLDQVVGRCRDEDQAARGHDGSSIVRGADLERNEGGHAERTVPPSRTERPIPQRLSGGKIDRADAAIWRSGTQHASRHLPSRVD